MCGIFGVLGKKIINNEYELFKKIDYRGPDRTNFLDLNNKIPVRLGFCRLSIMDLSMNGDQPFIYENKDRTIISMCNGEIYNFKYLKEKLNLDTKSSSDCEVIQHLYLKKGIDYVVKNIEGEYAFMILDINNKDNTMNCYLGRDHFGVRPLFFCHSDETFGFCSEAKGLVLNDNKTFSICGKDNIEPLLPGCYLKCNFIKEGNRLKLDFNTYRFYDNSYKMKYDIDEITSFYLENTKLDIRKQLTKSVEDRLMSDRPLGALLSGGLDSSLVCSIASKKLKLKGKKLNTFSVGIPGSTDKKYAEMVAKYIGSNHTHVEFTNEEFINALKEVIYVTETYDITTVRASTGQYLISKWIKNNTDIKVLLIGDGSDELCSGYMYFHNSPSPEDSHNENKRLLEEIFLYDVLRADRGVSSNGLEARVPFLDYKFVDLYMSIDPRLRVPQEGIEKWLLRKSFDTKEYLPDEVLYRKKEAFSDGVSGEEDSWFKIIQEYVDKKYSDEYLKKYQENIYLKHNVPQSKEGMYYREIFNSYYGNYNINNLIPNYWLPRWCGDIKDPSARVLNVYNKNNSNNKL